MVPFLCDYCSKHKLKIDPTQAYGKGKCGSCGEPRKIKKPKQGDTDSDVPPLHKQLLPLSAIVLSQCMSAGIILGGVDPRRFEETANFWLTNYGHPPDGKVQWCDHPHRIIAYDAASCHIIGGIHFQNTRTLRINASKSGYISAMAVDKHYRNRGVAKLLMVAAVEQLVKDGCTTSHLIVTQFGMAQTAYLEHFYNRVGFIHEPTRFLTHPMVYAGRKKKATRRYEKLAGERDVDSSTTTNEATFLPSPKTGLYTLNNIPSDYANKVFS